MGDNWVFISLLYRLPVETPIRGCMLNCGALVMFNNSQQAVALLSTDSLPR